VVGFNVIELLHVEVDLHIMCCRLLTFSRTVLLLQSGFRKEGSKNFVGKFIVTFMYVLYRSSREYTSDASVLTTRWHV